MRSLIADRGFARKYYGPEGVQIQMYTIAQRVYSLPNVYEMDRKQIEWWYRPMIPELIDEYKKMKDTD